MQENKIRVLDFHMCYSNVSGHEFDIVNPLAVFQKRWTSDKMLGVAAKWAINELLS